MIHKSELEPQSTSLEAVIYKGQIYQLAIIEKDGCFGKELEFAYVTESKRWFIPGFSSGGATGVGVGCEGVVELVSPKYEFIEFYQRHQ